jgi:hypothetical protein
MLDLLGNYRGGMAEWSMAVVLKTSADRLYQDGYIFPPNFTPIFAISGQILLDRSDLRGKGDNRSSNFARKLLI